MNFLLAFIFSLVSVIGYSIISIFIGKVAAKNGAYWTSFWIQTLGLLLTFIFIPVFGLHLSLSIYLLPLILFGVGGFFTFILYSKCLSIGPVPVVQSVLRLSNLITFILAILFLGDSVNSFKIAGAILLITGAILVSLDAKQLLRMKIHTLTKALPASLLQVLINGIVFVFLAIAIKHFDGFSANVGVRFIIVPLFLLSSIGRPKAPGNFLKNSWGILLFIAGIDTLAFILFNLSVQLYEVSFTSMMQSAIPLITAIISTVFFHEKLKHIQKIGIIVGFLGGVLLAMSG